MKEEKEEEKPEIQYHEFDYSEDGESGELAEEFLQMNLRKQRHMPQRQKRLHMKMQNS